MLGQMGRLWKVYSKCPIGVRLHVLGRYVACRYSTLVKWFPESGTILDVGCGHGLLAASLMMAGCAKERRYLGIDHDEEKIRIAESAQISNIRFMTQDIADVPSESYDCVSLVDVLYCVPLGQWPDLLGHCTRVLKNGGMLIVKEAIDRPMWKRWFTYIEEFLAIKVFKITKGASPHFESVDVYRSYITMSGAGVDHVHRLDSWRPYPHCLFVARKS